MSRDDWLALAVFLGGGWLLLDYLSVSAARSAMAKGEPIDVKLTNYHPFDVTSTAERTMEGGVHDRMGNPLHTLEDFQNGQAPYVSVSGDQDIWPYGQRLEIANWPGVVFRVVDTGSHFHGATKVFRVAGYEPLDICCASRDTNLSPTLTSCTAVEGDSFAQNYTRGTVSDVQYDKLYG